jgi:LAGLIDADG endonuclease
MPKLKPYDLSKVTALDLAYLAGFIDGEGCFFIGHHMCKSACTGNIYPNYHTILKISNNCREVLEWILEKFGGRITKFNKTQMKDRNHFTYEIYMTGNLLTDVTELLIPYLRVKKLQAEVMLQMRRTFSRTGSCGPVKQDTAILERRAMLREQMVRLNSRFKNHTYTNHFPESSPLSSLSCQKEVQVN